MLRHEISITIDIEVGDSLFLNQTNRWFDRIHL